MQNDKIHNELITKIAKKLRGVLESTVNKGIKEYYQFSIGPSDLENNYLFEDIRKKPSVHYDLMEQLKKLEGPVLYWFEITSGTDCAAIRNAITQHKAVSNRVVPYLMKHFKEDSTCLYVGKVKGNFYGRIIQHMGFNSGHKMQGLQLFHWAKPLGLEVKVHCYQLYPEMIDMINMMELELAYEKNPIVGKH